MRISPLRTVLLTLMILLTSGGAAAGQTPVPDAPPAAAAAVNLPPIVNASVSPRRVIYLDTESTAGALLQVDATASEDPEGLPLNYAHDVNGDGVFTPWFFRAEAGELITMPGAFVVTARARDPLGGVGEQQIPMLARQFSRDYVSFAARALAFGLVHGRPAFVYGRGNGDLLLLGNDQTDGGGPWRRVPVRTGDAVKRWFGLDEPNWSLDCQLDQRWGGTLLCTFYLRKSRVYELRYLVAEDAWAGEWSDVEVVRVNGDPAATLGAVGMRPAILYHNSGALALLVANWDAGADAVTVGGGFELMWSENVGAALPNTHSRVISVGETAALPAFVYLNATRGQLLYAVNRQPDGRGQWDIVPIEGQAGDIGAPSLAVIAGRPAVAYRDGAKGHLKLAVSETADGRGKWQVLTVYPTAAGGPRIQSLAAIDGRAGIAFEDAARGMLFAYDPGVKTGNYWPVAVVDDQLTPLPLTSPRNLTLIALDGRPALGYGPAMQFATAR